MKKTLILASLAIFWSVAFASCGGGKSAETQAENAAEGEQIEMLGSDGASADAPKAKKGKAPKNLRTEMDSLAYALGFDVGSYLRNLDTTQLKEYKLNIKNFFAAINDIMADKPKMSRDDAFSFMNEFMMVRVPERNKKASEEFLAKIEKENRNIQKTESGLMYEIIEMGDETVKATKNEDVVKVLYEGQLRDGTVFDSSAMHGGDTTEFALNRVIRGWGEGMKFVGKGGKIKLYVPSDLGYGQRGAPPTIGSNEALVFDVTLVDVTPAPEPEEQK